MNKMMTRAKPLYPICMILCLTLLWSAHLWNAHSAYGQNSSSTRDSADHNIMVPDTFLRRWDPVTFFFTTDTGPGENIAEDHAERYVTVTPAHPGAYTWLNRRTLQFRPAEPWPPLTRFAWTVQGQTVELATLMSTPTRTIPAHKATGLPPVEAITLTFPEPLDPAALAQMIAIELRPLPGIEAEQSRWLDDRDFDIKIMERKNRADTATYVIAFHHPIPMGIRAIVHMRLSLEEKIEEAFYKISFSTAEPFYVTRLGCSNQAYPVTSKGVLYSREQAIQGTVSNQAVVVQFSSNPVELGPIEARNLVRFTPGVENLSFNTTGNRLILSGDFNTDTLYEVRLEPTQLLDRDGRSLQMEGPSRVYIYFPPASEFIQWNTGHGIIERFGPQMVPLTGRGFDRLDMRIYPIDPLNRSFWPFPKGPVAVNEMERPAGPGEEPPPFNDSRRFIPVHELARQIKALGSPTVSTLVPLPLRKKGGTATFGLDLQPYLEQISGKAKAGTYLVGMRRLDSSKEREWIRVQVTDLCLTTSEEAEYVQFIVTSLSTGDPVRRALIRVEGSGSRTNEWTIIASGKTDETGKWSWKAPGNTDWRNRHDIRRIVVETDQDMLVLDPTNAPDTYADNVWTSTSGTWLQWTQLNLSGRKEPDQTLCHIFTERPVYQPDDPVHIKGYIRKNHEGAFSNLSGKGYLVVNGPGDLEWRYPLDITSMGSFYHLFEEEKLPTGEYSAQFEYQQNTYGYVHFRKEAYRLPRFEILLNGPGRTGLDQGFSIQLTATYYAGGKVAGQPVRWRVTQFPYTWAPEKREGFIYSTDARFSRGEGFRSTPMRETEDHTDDQGGATLFIDPTIEPTAQPRQYIVEATVTGADDQTVSGTHQILALPPFVLGLKAPRFVKDVQSIDPEMIVVGPDGKLLEGKSITVRLLQRQWHSYLQAGDFSQNVAKYITDIVDEKVYETTFVSEAKSASINLPIQGSGVYIIEMEAQDQLGRSQIIQFDLFAGAKEPVTWAHPPTRVLKVTPERAQYAPGETAALILESPFQTARALVVVEKPNGINDYHWIPIRNGAGTFNLPIDKTYMPRIPVHFVLMRGRGNGDKAPVPGQPDLGKPATLAATVWVEISLKEHQVTVDLQYPSKVLPGASVTVDIKLTDDKQRPIPGEVTLWLVDQAVLALGKEQRLDPLPDFIVSRSSYLSFHDTRNLAIGYLPFMETPGGGMAMKEAMPQDLLDKVTVRKTFQPVPYFNPSIIVGKNGTASVHIKMPDNLTNFKVRAKVVSGPDRFGYGKGQISVRLPVIVQPGLPRFVRPGDTFTAIAVGRIVEGAGGPGRSEIRLEGLQTDSPAVQEFSWDPQKPQRIEYPLFVPTPEYTEKGSLSRDTVTVTLGVERSEDKARDAFRVTLPIRYDRKPVIRQDIMDLKADSPVTLAAITDPVRPGTFHRSVLIAGQPDLIKMAAGLDYLLAYPHGCTEQRISIARAQLAAKRFRDLLYQEGAEDRMERQVKQTLEWIEAIVDNNGLAAYWPGAAGNVSLTAWVVQFMVEAKQAGFQVNDALLSNLVHTLQKSLRSDYGFFIQGEAFAERCWALTALADAGEIDTSYAAELARRSNYLNLESKAQVVRALYRSGATQSSTVEALMNELWKGIVIRLYQGREIYGGLQETAGSRNALILPSETRTIAQILRAISMGQSDEASRQQILIDAMVTLGQGNGWGSTNANSEALLALSEIITSADDPNKEKTEPIIIDVRSGAIESQITLVHSRAMQHLTNTYPGDIQLTVQSAQTEKSLAVRSQVAYTPLSDGSMVTAFSQGFVVHREILKIQQENLPPARVPIDGPGKTIDYDVGDVIEEHIEIVNPEDRHYVAVVIPLPAGMEPLNPNLATAPPEAKPKGQLSMAPTYVAFMDDQMGYYYDTLPKGTFHFYFRTRATIPGKYVQPAAFAEMMYNLSISGNGNGAWIRIRAKE